MNLLLPQFSMPRLLDRLWARLKGTEMAPFIAHRSQVVPLAYALKGDRSYAKAFAEMFFAEPLRGAGSGWESRMPLPMEPGSTSPVDASGTNSLVFFVPDFCEVMSIRFGWKVAGTTTLLIADFDLYPAPNSVGTVVDKLDGTNGTITAPSQASQAIGAVIYKDLGDTLKIDLDPPMSVQFNVTTTVTAGTGTPAVIVLPRAETMANLSTALAFLSA